ncbi:MAG: O-antigen ligase family protein, partial [Anaerolineae bacterium]|nr:O-antigen ligase family protein [Anaerolineae bacterium]
MALVSMFQRLRARSKLGYVLSTLAVCLVGGVLVGAYVALLTPLWAAALAAGIVGGLLMLRSRDFTFLAIIAIILLLPFASVPLNVGFSPTFLNLALGVLFLVWAVRFATGVQEPWVSSPVSPAVTVLLLLTLAAFIAGLGHASLTATSLRKFAEIPLGIAIYFAVLNLVRSRRDVERLTTWLVLGATGAAVLGIVLYVIPENLSIRLLSALRIVRYPAGPDVLRYVEDNPELPMRAISTSVDPNVLGTVLILVMGLAAPHLFAPRAVLGRKWLALCLGVCGICVYLTYSRGALVGLVAALLLLGLARYRRALLVIIVACALILLLPQTQGYVARFVEGVRGEDLATQMRFGEYKDALILIQRYPWLGVGFVDPPDIDLYLGVSNLYLLIAEEMGLLGLGVFLVCLAAFYLVLLDAWRRDRARAP